MSEDELVRLEACRQDLRDVVRRDIHALAAEIRRLRAALKPFADYAERVDHFPAGVAQQDAAPAKVEWWPGMVPTLGDCRGARRVLEGKADA